MNARKSLFKVLLEFFGNMSEKIIFGIFMLIFREFKKIKWLKFFKVGIKIYFFRIPV